MGMKAGAAMTCGDHGEALRKEPTSYRQQTEDSGTTIPTQTPNSGLLLCKSKENLLCLISVLVVRILWSTAKQILQAYRQSELSHLPSKSGMESLEKVSKVRRSFPSLDPLRLCLCFLRKKDLRAAADSVFEALLSSLTSDMLSLLENSWSILQPQGMAELGRAHLLLSPHPHPLPLRRARAGSPSSANTPMQASWAFHPPMPRRSPGNTAVGQLSEQAISMFRWHQRTRTAFTWRHCKLCALPQRNGAPMHTVARMSC